MTNLHTLLEKLEKCEGPDREIDADISRVCVGERDEWTYLGEGRWDSPDGPLYAEHYTASLDAAVALVEKMLPNLNWGLDGLTLRNGYTYGCELDDNDSKSYRATSHHNAALALLTALIKALIAEEENG